MWFPVGLPSRSKKRGKHKLPYPGMGGVYPN